MSKTKSKINHTTDKINELEEKLKRSLADYANLEKRIESQRQLFVTLTTTAIVIKMIEVLDDLYLVYKHLKDPGLKMALDKFINVLKSEGVEEIEALNKKFDPQTMDCVEAVSGPENQVVSIRKPGYKLNGHIIRPSQVTVGQSTDQKITN